MQRAERLPTAPRGGFTNMARQAGRRGEPLVDIYCASKAAVISLTSRPDWSGTPRALNSTAFSPIMKPESPYEHSIPS